MTKQSIKKIGIILTLAGLIFGVFSLYQNTRSFGGGVEFETVTRVIDGDTFTINSPAGKKTIRILGIDTPETKKPRTAVECYGPEASARLKELLTDQIVILTSDKTNKDKDYFGRLLRQVKVSNENKGLDQKMMRDVGEIMIREGYARAYRKYPFVDKDKYIMIEAKAKEQKAGLWGACFRE